MRTKVWNDILIILVLTKSLTSLAARQLIASPPHYLCAPGPNRLSCLAQPYDSGSRAGGPLHGRCGLLCDRYRLLGRFKSGNLICHFSDPSSGLLFPFKAHLPQFQIRTVCYLPTSRQPEECYRFTIAANSVRQDLRKADVPQGHRQADVDSSDPKRREEGRGCQFQKSASSVNCSD